MSSKTATRQASLKKSDVKAWSKSDDVQTAQDRFLSLRRNLRDWLWSTKDSAAAYPLSRQEVEDVHTALGWALAYPSTAEMCHTLQEKQARAIRAYRKTKGRDKHKAATKKLGFDKLGRNPAGMTDHYLHLTAKEGRRVIEGPAGERKLQVLVRPQVIEEPSGERKLVLDQPLPAKEALQVLAQRYELSVEACRTELVRQRKKRKKQGLPVGYVIPQTY